MPSLNNPGTWSAGLLRTLQAFILNVGNIFTGANTFRGTQTFSDTAGTGAGDLRAIAGQGIRIANSAGTGVTVDLNGSLNMGNSLLMGSNNIKGTNILEFNSTTAAQLVANTNDWTGVVSSIMRVSTDAARDLTGIANGVEGRTVVLINVGAFNLVLKHQVTSSAVNQLLCSTGADITLAGNQAADLIYDSTTQRWRVFKRN